ncbi:DUF4389 domain-containing protein [Aestuariicella sp. G3-2]|uniref:DUF4389 domain-containing protein n=1 Tax=Pseudomaricurvus albidus TaxID=2842452 RepID=UPI001C0C3B17|nr:DUF4389 domain-containing protein [Aestuariicella albida]MBU3070308.1 DUF4389 domain-containing protein [Aestuariicella albida]
MKSNLLSSTHWLRLVFMVLFAVILQVAAAVMWVVVILQFLFSLFTGQNNDNLREFGHSLSVFIYQTWQFLSYNSEEKPYPFQDWPDSK